MKKIILASNSPRRKEILEGAKVEFDILVSNCREYCPKYFDINLIKKNSYNKAHAILDKICAPALIIGADTVVVMDNLCLIKPKNIFDAFFMLRKLSNRTHFVYTSHTIIDSLTQKAITEVSKSSVTFRKLNFLEIIEYILKYNPLDKAGSYGIQDFIPMSDIKAPDKKSFISKIEGSYLNIVGFDIELVLKMFSNF